jgi:UDP-N-acetylglucosamine 2-epimerase
MAKAKNPFGDGKAAKRIAEYLITYFDKGISHKE